MANTVIKLYTSYKKYSSGEIVASNPMDVKSDTVSCIVTEERNGIFMVKLKYIRTGAYAGQFRRGRTLEITVHLGKDQNVDPLQHFDIYSVEKDENYVIVYAKHIFYRLMGYLTPPFTQTGITISNTLKEFYLWDCINGAFNESKNFTLNELTSDKVNPFNEFSFAGLIGSSNNIKKENMPYQNNRLAFLSDCLLDIVKFFGGEICRDNFYVKAGANRGQGRGSVAKYGLNIEKFDFTNTNDSAYNTLMVYRSETVKEDGYTKTKYHFESPYSLGIPSIGYRLPYLLDTTGMQNKATPGGFLYVRAREILREQLNDSGLYNIRINLADVLNSTEGSSEEFADVHEIAICDTIMVEYMPQQLFNTELKVVKTEFDVLKARYTTIELGDVINSFENAISKINALNAVATNLEYESGTHYLEESSMRESIVNSSGYATQALAEAEAATRIANIAKSIVQPLTTFEAGGNIDTLTAPGGYVLWGNYTYTETVNNVTTAKNMNIYGIVIVSEFHGYITHEITQVSSASDTYDKLARRRRANGQWGRFRKQTWELA